MEIVNCKSNNLEECAFLLCEVYREPEYQEEWTQKEAHNYLERFFKIEPNKCFVALENDKIVGGIFAYSYPWRSEALVYVQELFVASDQRKKGIAQLLMKKMAIGKNTKVWLVANENTGASKFYKKIGFKENGPYKFNYGEV